MDQEVKTTEWLVALRVSKSCQFPDNLRWCFSRICRIFTFTDSPSIYEAEFASSHVIESESRLATLLQSLSNHQLVFHPRPCINHDPISNIYRFTNRCFFSRRLRVENSFNLSGHKILPDPWHCGWLQVPATTELKTRQEAEKLRSCHGNVAISTSYHWGLYTNLLGVGSVGFQEADKPLQKRVLGMWFSAFSFSQVCHVHPSLLYNLSVSVTKFRGDWG